MLLGGAGGAIAKLWIPWGCKGLKLQETICTLQEIAFKEYIKLESRTCSSFFVVEFVPLLTSDLVLTPSSPPITARATPPLTAGGCCLSLSL